MASDHELNRDVDVDLGGIFGGIWRHKSSILIVSIFVTAVVFMVLQVMSPRYRSEARILIRAGDAVLTGPSSTNSQPQASFDDPDIASQVQLLQSRTIARKIVDAFDLKARAEFDGTLNPSPVDQMLETLGLSEGGRAVTAEDRVLESYFDKLKVFQAERARVIVVQFWSTDPELAAAISNKIADEYLALQEAMKRGANPDELDRLKPELKALRNSVMQAESAVAEFRESSDLLQGRDNDTLATQELSELSTELGRVRAQLSQSQANAASVRQALESGSLDAASSVLQSALIQRLRERQVALDTQMSELLTTLLPGHPRIQRVKSQLATLTTQIRAEAGKIEESLQREAEVARNRENDLIQQRNVLKSEAGRVGKAQVELRALEREADAQRQLLNAYLVRFKEAQARQNREFLPADAYVFARAQEQSKAYFPKKVPILAAAFFGTLVLASMITLAGGILSGTAAQQAYRDEYEVVRRRELDSADLPRQEEQPAPPPATPPLPEIVSPPPGSNVEPFETAESGRRAGAVSALVAANTICTLGQARIAVISPDQHGSGPVTAELARAVAVSAGSSSVIVLDMTGQGSSTRHMLRHTGYAGIKDLMAGQASFGETIHGDTGSSAHIMPVGNASPQIAASNVQQLPAILEALQATYDFLIIDCGDTSTDGLSRISDVATYTVIATMNEHSPHVDQTRDMIEQAGFGEPLVVEYSYEEAPELSAIAG